MALLESLKENKKVSRIPENDINKAELLEEKEKKYKKYLKLYLLLKKIENARCEGREEYRKHVTMIVHFDSKILEVTVPTLEEYFSNVRDFVNLVENDLK
jgi:hypothetical protein